MIKSSSTSLNFFLEETNTFDNSLPESETFCFNLEEISSGSPISYSDLSLPDYEAFFCDSEPDSGNFTMDVVEDIFDNPTREPRVNMLHDLPTHPTCQLNVLASNEETSPHLLSHRGFNPPKIIFDFSKSPMMISGGDIPILDVLIARIFEASRACGFVLRSLELHILSFILGIQYPNLID
ncbi:hypothetical protein Tco_0144782 [Tanacetum coccineum]